MNTIKTWEERMEDDGHEQPISVYCRAEIAELRAALAARATPAQTLSDERIDQIATDFVPGRTVTAGMLRRFARAIEWEISHVTGVTTPAQPVQPCIAASEKHPLFYRKLADLQQRGYEIFGHILHKNGEYALFDDSCRWLTQPQYWRLMHEQDSSLFATPSPASDVSAPSPSSMGAAIRALEVGTSGSKGYVKAFCHGAAVMRDAAAALAEQQRPFCPTQQQFQEWCERHDMRADRGDVREAFDDAASLYLTAQDGQKSEGGHG